MSNPQYWVPVVSWCVQSNAIFVHGRVLKINVRRSYQLVNPLVSIAFSPFFFHILVFFHSLFTLSLDFIRVSSLRPMCMHPLTHSIDPSHADSEFPGLRLALVDLPDVVISEAEHGVRMKHKSRFKFLPWPGFEPQTSQSNGGERHHWTTAQPRRTFSFALLLSSHLSMTFSTQHPLPSIFEGVLNSMQMWRKRRKELSGRTWHLNDERFNGYFQLLRWPCLLSRDSDFT